MVRSLTSLMRYNEIARTSKTIGEKIDKRGYTIRSNQILIYC